ncbi:MAG: hypothetical protein HY892_01480 [Deltaproteobacteria bacterium]|nr:hypothetical protein [Deltaproteobacteria bacterium]
MNTKRGMRFCFAAAIVLLSFAVSVPVGANNLNRLLTGDYYGSSSYLCAASMPTFDDELRREGTGITFGGSSQGVTSYDGRGNYTFRGEVMSVNQDSAPAASAVGSSPVAHFTLVCNGTYMVDDDLSISGLGECRIDPLAGPYNRPPYPPGFYALIKNVRATGQLLGTAGNILRVGGQTEPNVETVIFFEPTGPTPFFSYERICTSSGTSMKIVGKGTNLRERGK